jgi:hypothetical protein
LPKVSIADLSRAVTGMIDGFQYALLIGNAERTGFIRIFLRQGFGSRQESNHY